MPKPELTPTHQVVTELDTKTRAQLMRELRLYEGLKEELEDTARDLDVVKSICEGLRDELGIQSVTPETGWHITRVDGQTSSSLDKPALMKAFKITPKQWASFIRHKPKKAYTLITTPKDEADAAAASAKPKAKRERYERDDDDRE